MFSRNDQEPRNSKALSLVQALLVLQVWNVSPGDNKGYDTRRVVLGCFKTDVKAVESCLLCGVLRCCS
jgi:hypothetical protein